MTHLFLVMELGELDFRKLFNTSYSTSHAIWMWRWCSRIIFIMVAHRRRWNAIIHVHHFLSTIFITMFEFLWSLHRWTTGFHSWLHRKTRFTTQIRFSCRIWPSILLLLLFIFHFFTNLMIIIFILILLFGSTKLYINKVNIMNS